MDTKDATATAVENLVKNDKADTTMALKLYKKRWCLLLLCVAYMVCNSAQWLQYSIIAKIVCKYYDISIWSVNWTSLVMMACYVPLGLPAANLMDRINLRWTAILGSLGTATGSWIKVFSAERDGFCITFVGQTVVAISQVLMLSVPQKLSSTWFGEKEVSSACSIGAFGFELGIVVGFFLPPMLVKNQEDFTLVGKDMFNMFLCFACASTFVALLVIIFFTAEPPLPPTRSQAKVRVLKTKPKTFRKVWKFINQRHLKSLFVTTGINNGCFNALSTLLSQIFLEYFPNKEEDAGLIGVTMVVFGMGASVLFGIILDRTKQFKLILIFMYYMSAVAMLTFTLVLVYSKRLLLVYIAAAFVGTFLCAYTAISFDVATELTYPESELMIGTIMNMSALFFTFIGTLVFGYINQTLGYCWSNMGIVITLVIGATMSLPIKFELRRTSAQRTESHDTDDDVKITL